jgi:hypothetical protein
MSDYNFERDEAISIEVVNNLENSEWSRYPAPTVESIGSEEAVNDILKAAYRLSLSFLIDPDEDDVDGVEPWMVTFHMTALLSDVIQEHLKEVG